MPSPVWSLAVEHLGDGLSHKRKRKHIFILRVDSKMGHAQSLRVIGQCLELAKISLFELANDGGSYFLSVGSLSKACEWILQNAVDNKNVAIPTGESAETRAFCFSMADILRLDADAQKQRANRSYGQSSNNLPQALRALGDHLDITETSRFHLSWKFDRASVDYQKLDGQHDSRTFTADQLGRLGSHSKYRGSRAGKYAFRGAKNLQLSGRLDTPSFPNWSPGETNRLRGLFRRSFKDTDNKE